MEEDPEYKFQQQIITSFITVVIQIFLSNFDSYKTTRKFVFVSTLCERNGNFRVLIDDVDVDDLYSLVFVLEGHFDL